MFSGTTQHLMVSLQSNWKGWYLYPTYSCLSRVQHIFLLNNLFYILSHFYCTYFHSGNSTNVIFPLGASEVCPTIPRKASFILFHKPPM